MAGLVLDSGLMELKSLPMVQQMSAIIPNGPQILWAPYRVPHQSPHQSPHRIGRLRTGSDWIGSERIGFDRSGSDPSELSRALLPGARALRSRHRHG